VPVFGVIVSTPARRRRPGSRVTVHFVVSSGPANESLAETPGSDEGGGGGRPAAEAAAFRSRP